MKKTRIYGLAGRDPRPGLFYAKLLLAALVLALLFASLPASAALAAPAGHRDVTENIDPEEEWMYKLAHLHWAGFYFDHVRLYPADFEDRADLARAHDYLEKYGVALRAANRIASAHAGFDFEGKVTHEVQAARSVRELAMYLQIMRGLREKIDAIPGGR